MTRAYVGLGSNLGERMDNLAEAIDRIGHLDSVHVVGVSKAYETEAWPDPDDPEFANAVVAVETSLEPWELLSALNIVEADMGRTPGEPNAPRVIDLDILLFGDEEMTSDTLTIPHPRLVDRDFAITPLVELAPDMTLPDGTPLSETMPTEGRVLRPLGPLTDVGEGHGQPLFDDEWVSVAESVESGGIVAGVDPGIIYQASILQEEGIPIGWEPFDPTNMSDPWGVAIPVRLMVPCADKARALAVLADVAKAVPILDEEVEWAIESEPDEKDID